MHELILAVLLLAAPAALTPHQQAEVQRVEESLLAPCCYSQSVAQHMSPVAEQMRQEIAEMVGSGKSEAAILDHYKAMYGERILIVPGGGTGRVLYVLPALGVALGAAMLILFLRNALNPKSNAKLSSGAAIPADPRGVLRAEMDRLEDDF